MNWMLPRNNAKQFHFVEQIKTAADHQVGGCYFRHTGQNGVTLPLSFDGDRKSHTKEGRHLLKAYYGIKPPHSMTVKPLRSGADNSCGSISMGAFRGFHVIKMRIRVSGAGVMVRGAAFV